MAAIQTIPTIISIAKVSQYLVNCAVANGQLYGKKIDPDWGKTLYMERKAIEWMYGQDPTYSTLRETANYVYQLCYKANIALGIVNGGSGGTPVTQTSGGAGQYWVTTGVVTATDTAGQPTTGTLTWTHPYFVGATQVAFLFVDGVPETIESGAFTFNPANGTVTRSQNFFTGQVVILPFLRAASTF